ncbi:hypothetical protein [Bartonella sp. WD12.1]|uniref:hypothetical protein n=1 Tax=Bartonella sp. WD12.1 TaxID=1933903 RepID=UPI00099909B7|nr:hypothetical protein [Bartonella sp. WD12.1]OPB30204.1 hypothetical protein BWD121_012580 [Bartonella sp. WD12.1]
MKYHHDKNTDALKKNTVNYAHPYTKHQRIGHLKTEEMLIETSNPYFQPTHKENPSNPRTIIAVADAHSRPIALLYAKGHISKAQYKAAERFYYYWHIQQGNTHMGIDYTRQKVDGGHYYTDTLERQMEATDQLQTIKIQLGILGYQLVEQVIGYNQSIKDLSPLKRRQNSLADHLRDCLDLMATHWGYAKT